MENDMEAGVQEAVCVRWAFLGEVCAVIIPAEYRF